MKSWSVHSVLSSNQYVIKGFHVFQHYDEKKKAFAKVFKLMSLQFSPSLPSLPCSKSAAPAL